MTELVETKKEVQPFDFFGSLNAMLEDNKKMEAAVKVLLSLPVYSKMKPDEVFAILIQAKLLEIDPFTALNSDLFCVNGRVGMYAHAMSARIRNKGHSIVKDAVSNSIRCIVHGKRCDTGDASRVEYTIEEAVKAGLVRPGSNWEKHPASMLYARAVSKLAKELFSDVLRGDVLDQAELDYATPSTIVNVEAKAIPTTLSPGQVEELEKLFKQVPDVEPRVLNMYKLIRISELHPSNYEFVRNWILKEMQARSMHENKIQAAQEKKADEKPLEQAEPSKVEELRKAMDGE